MRATEQKQVIDQVDEIAGAAREWLKDAGKVGDVARLANIEDVNAYRRDDG